MPVLLVPGWFDTERDLAALDAPIPDAATFAFSDTMPAAVLGIAWALVAFLRDSPIMVKVEGVGADLSEVSFYTLDVPKRFC